MDTTVSIYALVGEKKSTLFEERATMCSFCVKSTAHFSIFNTEPTYMYLGLCKSL